MRVVPPSAVVSACPSIDEIAPPEPVRPGEFRDPLPLPRNGVLDELSAQARAAGAPPGLAISLAVESQLLLMDIEAAGIPRAAARTALTKAAEAPSIDGQLPAGLAAYLRALTIARRPSRVAARSIVHATVPARLSARLATLEITDVLSDADVVEALSWEAAAAAAGRTLAEWALCQLLAGRPDASSAPPAALAPSRTAS
jgi:hypothetical protein